jgi:hypothetical protein
MNIPVYRKGTWISYTVPKEGEHFWSRALQLQAASVFATASVRGYSPHTCAILAESYVYKQLYPGLMYSEEIEEKLKSFLV